MTTIAFDGDTFAVDRQVTIGGSTPIHSCKIHSIKWNNKPAYCAAAGELEHYHPIIEWLKGGEKPEVQDDKKTFAVMIVTKAKEVFMADESTHFHSLGKIKWAIGSGGEFALGAMYAGKDAKEAVEIACQLDINSGCGIDTVTIK